jgi:hypothetical protein
MPGVAEMIRYRALPYAVALWALVCFAAMAGHGGQSWHFFVQGGHPLADFDDPPGSDPSSCPGGSRCRRPHTAG